MMNLGAKNCPVGRNGPTDIDQPDVGHFSFPPDDPPQVGEVEEDDEHGDDVPKEEEEGERPARPPFGAGGKPLGKEDAQHEKRNVVPQNEKTVQFSLIFFAPDFGSLNLLLILIV